jgi:hypothetical protein
MNTGTEISIMKQAEIFVAKVQARYRWATRAENPHALDADEAIVRANNPVCTTTP